MVALVLNAGSNSLKFDVIQAETGQSTPSAGRRLVSGSVDDIGKEAVLTYGDTRVNVRADSYAQAADQALAAVRPAFGEGVRPGLVAHRVVHGGDEFHTPVRIDARVAAAIERWEDAAPLHNAPALERSRQHYDQGGRGGAGNARTSSGNYYLRNDDCPNRPGAAALLPNSSGESYRQTSTGV